jgi:hypothetical protein
MSALIPGETGRVEVGVRGKLGLSPLCGMPMHTVSMPSSAAWSMSAFIPGTSVSQPSSPKRLAAAYLFARNDSNLSIEGV